ncbi:hypothetical protein [Aureivirga marina]|uniref:hypothetical protein n=1 Tax=Aureivirga marina TaxID=1182451 RepID=UPI0018CB1FFC|nr:hypothetical protein [Aureivirga marina]
MKTNLLVCVFSLFTFFVFAQRDQQGYVTYKDSTETYGYVRIAKNKVVFKNSTRGKSRKLDSNEILGVTLIPNGKEIHYDYVKLAKKRRPRLLKRVIGGEMSLYEKTTSQFLGDYDSRPTSNAQTSLTYIEYFIKKKGALEGHAYVVKNFDLYEQDFREIVNRYFSDCPDIIFKVDAGVFRIQDYQRVVEYYNQNCLY